MVLAFAGWLVGWLVSTMQSVLFWSNFAAALVWLILFCSLLLCSALLCVVLVSFFFLIPRVRRA